MRFDTSIYFQRITPGEYDAITGNYSENAVIEDQRYADITDTGTDIMHLLYGGLKQGSLTIRLQAPYNLPFDHIRIGSKIYNVDRSRMLRSKQVLFVSEVQ